jgi:hypothetical protein
MQNKIQEIYSILMKIIERLKEYIEYKSISFNAFDKSIEASNGYIGRQIKNNASIGGDIIEKISCIYSDLNIDWLITGIGKMLRTDSPVNIVKEYNEEKKLIPFYDDISTVGGANSLAATDDCNMPVSEWIDAGDWFHEATAAIRHYGDSMQEYPSGCILALKKVVDARLILWGRNYCIETTEFRITKRLQKGDKDTYIAYSSNTNTYPDGHLIHEPIHIPKETIRHLHLVLGCVVKEYSSGAVMVKK